MRLSTIAGDAFVDFSAANKVTPYLGDLLTIKDSSSNQLTGYIKAAGSGETYGSQLLSNTTFATTAGVGSTGSTVASLSSGCFSATCLQLTLTEGYGVAYQDFSATNGMLLKGSAYLKKGTETSDIFLEISNAISIRLQFVAALPASWALSSVYATADSTASTFTQVYAGVTSGETSLFDTASMVQVLTPSATGVTIASSTTSTTVYYASYSTTPNQIFEDGSRLTQNTVSYVSLSPGQWYLDTANSRIWVYTTAGDNPSGHTMEASQRSDAINVGTNSYVTISGIDAERGNTDNISIAGGAGDVVSGSTSQWAFGRGILFYLSTGGLATGNTVAYSGSDGINVVQSPNPTVQFNVVHNNAELTNVLYTAGIHIGVDTTGQTTNALVQGNQVYSNGVGQATNIGWGIFLDTIGTGAVVKDNITYLNNTDGINIDAFNGATVDGNVSYSNGQSGSWGQGIWVQADANTSLTGQQVYNNTVWGNYNGGITFAGPNPEQSSGCTNNIAKNNIAVNTTAGPNFLANNGCENPGTDGSGNVYTYNDFGPAASNFITWGASNYSTYATWETATGNCGITGCSHSVQANPTFANAAGGQFWQTVGSSGIASGTPLGAPYNIGIQPGSSWPTNVFLVPNTNNDLGAFVYTGTVIDSVTGAGTQASGTTR